MRKSLFCQLSMLVALIVLMSACSKKVEYTNAIPANSMMVNAIDLKSLAEKAGINDNENKEVLQKLTDALKSGMNATVFQQLEAILKDPAKSGIDLREPIYLFVAPGCTQAGLVAKVINEDDLKSLIAAAEKEQLSTPISQESGYSFTLINQRALLAFTPSAVIMASYDNATQLETLKQTIATSLKQTEENSLVSKKGFRKMQEMKGDITMYMSFESLPKAYISQMRGVLADSLNWKELMLLGSLSFEKGKVEIVAEPYTDNAELKAQFEKSAKTHIPIQNTLLTYFPQSAPAMLSVGINGTEVFKNLQENRIFEQYLPGVPTAELKQLFEALQNDITVGLTSVTANGVPNFLLLAEARNGDALKALYEKRNAFGLSKQPDIQKLKEDEYLYKLASMNLFFGLKEKKIYITNDEAAYRNMGNPLSPSVADCAYAPEIKDQLTAFVINIEAICAMPIVQMFVQYGGHEAATYFAFCNKISYIEGIGNYEKGTIKLQMKDKDVNALKQIVDFAKEFAGM